MVYKQKSAYQEGLVYKGDGIYKSLSSASFAFTRLVASSSLALYNQMSTQATPPSDTRNWSVNENPWN